MNIFWIIWGVFTLLLIALLFIPLPAITELSTLWKSQHPHDPCFFCKSTRALILFKNGDLKQALQIWPFFYGFLLFWGSGILILFLKIKKKRV